MRFFITYTGMPHAYTIIGSSNSKSALNKAKKYRPDAVVRNPTDKVFTFEDAHNFASYWKHITLEQAEHKETYEVYDCNKDITEGIVALEDTKTIESLNPQNLLEFCKKRSGCRTGVIWVSQNGSLVFGDKVKNKARALVVLNKIKLERLK
jgi:hypothetical protein